MTARLDAWMPVSHWSTHHNRYVASPPTAAARALREVTAAEMRVMRPLVALRTLPSQLFGGETARKPAPAGARVDMTRMGFIVLDDLPDADLVLGFVGQPWKPVLSKAVLRDLSPAEFASFDRPGYIKGVYALWAEPDGTGTRLRTETRVYATDRGAARRFRPYWFLIEPFSGLIRRDWLAAVGRRAERAGPAEGAGPAPSA
ncbi:MAG TPA: hypothetical protein DEQ61_14830 [Streptomyces sp.]|nr:hypothetical protein [Streptomyces sp.]